ncbi:hypothetical protein ACFSC6_06735 [Rufibacter sediminis]|uniref:Glucose/Sorbosone dehydrogenase domain-containing protein n=1 Tax=Rufibacter sediminis TaxID=2762756 RepID=A0ABR6VVY8_9BACT|nr:hypothetical protein [Rufibacter sediminis]MBC3541074.1 hypothetical protein [Rufibacter sediminis]
MAVAPNGDLLVLVPGKGRGKLVRPNAAGSPQVSDFVTGLARPHNLVFYEINGTLYLYIAEKNKISRYTHQNGDVTGQNRQVVVDNLPDANLPELNGNYGHELKNIALGRNHNLYVPIASTCNACAHASHAYAGEPSGKHPLAHEATTGQRHHQGHNRHRCAGHECTCCRWSPPSFKVTRKVLVQKE